MVSSEGGGLSLKVSMQVSIKTIYGALAILGLLLPYAQFMPWLADHGFNLPLVLQLATDSAISAFAWMDVVITAIAVLVFITVENQKSPVNRVWLPVAGTLLVGPSFGLPLFLWLRESQSIEGS